MSEEFFYPFFSMTKEDALKAQFFSNCRLAESGCWLWVGKNKTKSASDYGRLGRKLAHRLSHEIFKGLIPQGLHVLHSCDTPSCVNPAHLRAGTSKENVADCISRGRFRKSHGSLNNLAKLTDTDIVDIRNSTISPKLLSEKYGIDRTNVHQIVSGTTWQHVPMPEIRVKKADGRAKLTSDQVIDIKNADVSISNTKLARQYGVGAPLVCMIRNGKARKNVTASAQE
jgi:hypothetical protein